MPGNVESLVATMMVYVTTYLLHSTLLLGATWFVVRGFHIDNHRLKERLWKLAAVAALITTPLQLGLNLSNPVFTVLVHGRTPSQSASVGRTGTGTPSYGIRGGTSQEGVQRRRSRKASGELRQSPNTDEFTYDSNRTESGVRDIATASVRPGDSDAISSSLRLPGASGLDEFTAARDARPQSAQTHTSFLSAYVIVLAVIVIAGLVKLTCETLAFRRRLAGTRLLCQGSARAALDELLRQFSIRRSVQLLSSKDHSEPAAFGVLRWRIVLPDTIAEDLRSDELTALLGHELAHLVRGDTFWLWVGRLLCSCCAFQPLNFLARREWRRATEYLCDDWAVRHGVSELSLARCLTQVAAWKNDQRPCAVSLPVSGVKSNLSDRVERLVERRRRGDSGSRRFGRGLLWLTSLVATLTLPCWGPRTTLLAQAAAADGDVDASNSGAQVIRPFGKIALKGEPVRRRNHPDESAETDNETAIWRSITDEADKLQTELTLLEQDVTELAEMLNESDTAANERAFLGEVRARLKELNRRRRVLDAIGGAAAIAIANQVSARDIDVPRRLEK